MSVQIRPEAPADTTDIEAVTIAAFRHVAHGSRTEHLIVGALRRSGRLAASLVACVRGEIIGHAACSPVSLSSGEAGWYGLGPVSVVPERQRQRVGTRLVDRALAKLRELGAAGCVVLGDPGYYARFGFAPEPSLVLRGAPPEYFQALPFGGRVPLGTVTYHESFDVAANMAWEHGVGRP